MSHDAALSLATGQPFIVSKFSPAPADVATALLTEAEYALFAEFGRPRRVEAGQVLFRRAELGATMFVVARGQVDLDFGGDLAGKRLGPYEYFGELGLLVGDHMRSADAVAVGDGLLVELRHEEFQRLVDRDPALVSQFLRRAILRVVVNEQSLIRRLRRRNEELQSALDSLYAATHRLNRTEELIRTDELTGLYNRRGLLLHLQERRSLGLRDRLGLLLVDCDRFKRVNDEHGHVVGDRVLQGVASILRSVAGPEDLPCRLGGDEFCLLVAAGTREEVLRLGEFVVGTARSLLEMAHAPPLMCPLSVGACVVGPDGEWSDWYACADVALYQAKRAGGGTVRWRDPEGDPR
ncbi:GGDEF domain-containing protein [Vulcaniibacterium tengchongense]|uniref:diguanylate cyclase n=1 Tax=Vulcaniibacterium tengchongense TaxID=1273429 RepID=A0A3N4V4M5_9GAMM|nr:GGDEF domain-containing protein [Vulcaniibacterium tengchongense]RPE74701.1 diguanylate cyclase (GGDEF)-like protein [Vulcaniibacterium tengchongense]